MYKYGPFSFELRDDIASMRADVLVDLELRPAPYGPSLVPTDRGKALTSRFPKTISRYYRHIQWIAKEIGSHTASHLETIGSALYVLSSGDALTKNGRAVQRILSHKPHLSPEAAHEAILEAMKMQAAWGSYASSEGISEAVSDS